MHINQKIIKNKENSNNIYEYSFYARMGAHETIWIQWDKSDGDFVREGEILGEFKIDITSQMAGLSSTTKNYPLDISSPKATTNGFLKIAKLPKSYIKDGDVLFTITEDNVELEKIIIAQEEVKLNNKENLNSNQTKPDNNEKDTYESFTYSKNTLPLELRESKFYINKWYKKDGDFVNEGDLLISFRFVDFIKNAGANIHDVLAPMNGVLEICKQSYNWDFVGNITDKIFDFIVSDGDTIFKIHKQCDSELLKKLQTKLFESIPSITVDEFTNKKVIKWVKVCGRYKGFDILSESYDCLLTYSSEDMLMLSLNFIDDKDYLILRYNAKDFNLILGDKILFLFENNIQLKFEVVSKPFIIKKSSTGKIYETRIPMTSFDINVIKKENFIKWQIQFLETDKKITMVSGAEPYKVIANLQYALKRFANDYYDVVTKEIENYQPLIEPLQTEEKLSEVSDVCFVYLMVDHTNNYHKIGISNSPDYREKTLQSEKPTIEMICYKKFPNRKTASILEKTMHQTYSEKRIRGEWFQLANNEVEEIKIILQ